MAVTFEICRSCVLASFGGLFGGILGRAKCCLGLTNVSAKTEPGNLNLSYLGNKLLQFESKYRGAVIVETIVTAVTLVTEETAVTVETVVMDVTDEMAVTVVTIIMTCDK